MSTDFILKFPAVKSKPNSRAPSKIFGDFRGEVDEGRKGKFLEERIQSCLDYERSRDHATFVSGIKCMNEQFESLVKEIAGIQFSEPKPIPTNSSMTRELEELEEEISNKKSELAELISLNNEYANSVNKKNFFKEYDERCKEVESLRKVNSKLLEKVKRLQANKNN